MSTASHTARRRTVSSQEVEGYGKPLVQSESLPLAGTGVSRIMASSIREHLGPNVHGRRRSSAAASSTLICLQKCAAPMMHPRNAGFSGHSVVCAPTIAAWWLWSLALAAWIQTHPLILNSRFSRGLTRFTIALAKRSPCSVMAGASAKEHQATMVCEI